MGERVVSCHIIRNVSEASSEDGVGGRVGGLETRLLINPVTVVSALTSTRGSHHVQDCNPPLSNAKELRNERTGAREPDIYRGSTAGNQLFFFLILTLSIAAHYISAKSLARFNKCLCQLSPAWHHEEQPVREVCFTLSYK